MHQKNTLFRFVVRTFPFSDVVVVLLLLLLVQFFLLMLKILINAFLTQPTNVISIHTSRSNFSVQIKFESNLRQNKRWYYTISLNKLQGVNWRKFHVLMCNNKILTVCCAAALLYRSLNFGLCFQSCCRIECCQQVLLYQPLLGGCILFMVTMAIMNIQPARTCRFMPQTMIIHGVYYGDNVLRSVFVVF